MKNDGIEIHYDEKRGYLGLACESDAFAAYREVVRQQLSDFPDIDCDAIEELSVTDTTKIVARRDSPKRTALEMIILCGLIGTLIFAAIGIYSTIAWLYR